MTIEINRLSLFLGKPIHLNERIVYYPPTIDQIESIGEKTYALFVNFATFDKENIVKIMGISNPLIEGEDVDDYDALTVFLDKSITDFIAKAISFFVKSEVKYDAENNVFLYDGQLFLSRNNYKDFVEIVKVVQCINKEKEAIPEFRNDRARQLWMKEQEARLRKLAREGLQLKDILSIITYDYLNNGLNMFDAGRLTIYQMYERWERLGLKDKHSRLLKVWANGLLKDTDQLQEWMIKTKL